MSRRLTAAAALVLATVSLALALVTVVLEFPRGLLVLAGIVLALAAAWYGVVRRGTARAIGLGAALVLAALALLSVVTRVPVPAAVSVGCLLVSLAAARAAFRTHVTLPRAAPPAHPVLFFNPKSGGGKATRFHLADEARSRGIEPIELTLGADLETLVRDAVAGGADGLAMAGGDGSQAVVAAIAAEHGLPYACIPAGTRNHFALDLGVDRDDVVGALDAFVDGGERVVDLAEVNGRVFVNNVSLGLYAEAVQRSGYRDAKLRTLLDTVPDALGRGDGNGGAVALRWRDPQGATSERGAALLVSNNRYRLGRAIGSGTRPRIDEGRLGVTVLSPDRHEHWREWTVPDFEVDAAGQVPAGIDGEAVRLDPPLRFHVRSAALRVRIAPAHPGASPSARVPADPGGVPRALLAIALGRSPTR
jgi:diacylglycerol kinase family enzyme